jgi:hypothetical protein
MGRYVKRNDQNHTFLALKAKSTSYWVLLYLSYFNRVLNETKKHHGYYYPWLQFTLFMRLSLQSHSFPEFALLEFSDPQLP